jgi:hypothetical protein
MPFPGISEFLNKTVKPGQGLANSVSGLPQRQSMETQAVTSPANYWMTIGANNPFLIHSGPQQGGARQPKTGINQPLVRPMFLGYKDDKALYGGSRLFVLG